jgi:hypothetical protein
MFLNVDSVTEQCCTPQQVPEGRKALVLVKPKAQWLSEACPSRNNGCSSAANN